MEKLALQKNKNKSSHTGNRKGVAAVATVAAVRQLPRQS